MSSAPVKTNTNNKTKTNKQKQTKNQTNKQIPRLVAPLRGWGD